jgi:DNA-directed RNA polymerase subunit H (RpoH/RPB5)
MASQNKSVNVLIPPHRKLSKEEVESLLEEYSLSDVFKLPKIHKKDKGLLAYVEEVEVGDVIEIERQSFAGKTKFYRVVIN